MWVCGKDSISFKLLREKLLESQKLFQTGKQHENVHRHLNLVGRTVNFMNKETRKNVYSPFNTKKSKKSQIYQERERELG